MRDNVDIISYPSNSSRKLCIICRKNKIIAFAFFPQFIRKEGRTFTRNKNVIFLGYNFRFFYKNSVFYGSVSVFLSYIHMHVIFNVSAYEKNYISSLRKFYPYVKFVHKQERTYEHNFSYVIIHQRWRP